MGNPIARLSGVAVRPGVSRNGRLYSRDLIARAVARAQERLADPDAPSMTMLTHHAAADDSTLIVGRLTALTLDSDGAAHYESVLANTPEARTLLELIEPDEGGARFLKGVSIRGAWLGHVRHQAHHGDLVETADDLELDGLDFTKTPGVLGAAIDSVERLTTTTSPAETASSTSADGRHLIHESAEARVLVDTIAEQEYRMPATTPTTTNTGASQPGVSFADNGYRDGTKRYPLTTLQETVQAWNAFTQKPVLSQYSQPQLKRARQRISKALESYGFHVTGDLLASDVRPLNESAVAELFGDNGDGSFCVTLTNGPVQVTVSSWYCDPADLPQIGTAAMVGAVNALMGLDPDLDADIDVPGASAVDDPDGDAPKESARADGVVETDTHSPQSPAASTAAGTSPSPAVTNLAADLTEQEPAVSEPTTTEAGAQASPAPVVLTNDQFAALLARAAAPAAAPAVESAPTATSVMETEDQRIERLVTERLAAARPAEPAPVAETDEQRIARLVQEQVTVAVQNIVEAQGAPARKGVSRPVGDGAKSTPTGLPEDWPQKPIHEYTDEERTQFFGPALQSYVLGSRG